MLFSTTIINAGTAVTFGAYASNSASDANPYPTGQAWYSTATTLASTEAAAWTPLLSDNDQDNLLWMSFLVRTHLETASSAAAVRCGHMPPL